MTKRKGKTTMQISEANHAKLRTLGKMGDSLDDVLTRILKEVERHG